MEHVPQTLHAVLLVLLHTGLAYCPGEHVPQTLHTVSCVPPLQARLAYCPGEHPLQTLHTASFVPPHTRDTDCPLGQVEQGAQVQPAVT